MKIKPKVSQEEVSAALQQFLNKGGVIMKLPDQPHAIQPMIGEEKYEVYETIKDLSAMSQSME